MKQRVRTTLLRQLDLWSHRGHRLGRERGRVDRLLCDAWEYHVTAGESGRRLWPLTEWSYEPWSVKEGFRS